MPGVRTTLALTTLVITVAVAACNGGESGLEERLYERSDQRATEASAEPTTEEVCWRASDGSDWGGCGSALPSDDCYRFGGENLCPNPNPNPSPSPDLEEKVLVAAFRTGLCLPSHVAHREGCEVVWDYRTTPITEELLVPMEMYRTHAGGVYLWEDRDKVVSLCLEGELAFGNVYSHREPEPVYVAFVTDWNPSTHGCASSANW